MPPRALESVYLNKRLNKLTNLTLAVLADVVPLSNVETVDNHVAQSPGVLDEPPHCLPNPFGSVFRDCIVNVPWEVKLWLEGSFDGLNVCKGIRTMDVILGQWRDDVSFDSRSLVGQYLVNVTHAGRHEICISRHKSSVHDHFLVEHNSTIVWWTSGNGNVVRVDTPLKEQSPE